MVPAARNVILNKSKKELQVTFADGSLFTYPAELLRAESLAANSSRRSVEGHMVVAGRRYVSILKLEPVGSYAVRLIFDDLHASAIYSWAALYDMGRNKYAHMRQYLTLLKSQGLSRDPKARRPSPNHRAPFAAKQ